MSTDVLRLQDIKRVCSTCSLRELCLPYGISEAELKRLERIVARNRPVARGSVIFRQGDPLMAIYAVRTGSVKSCTVDAEGREQVIGFHFPGELVGLDAIARDAHDCTVSALETTSLCLLPYRQLNDLSDQLPELKRQLLRIMSRELVDDQRLLLTLGKKTAEERMAALLLSLSERFASRGLSAREFHLPMSRSDIASYLGLAVETVSRILARFQEGRVIAVRGRQVRLLDLSRLKTRIDLGGAVGSSREA